MPSMYIQAPTLPRKSSLVFLLAAGRHVVARLPSALFQPSPVLTFLEMLAMLRKLASLFPVPMLLWQLQQLRTL